MSPGPAPPALPKRTSPKTAPSNSEECPKADNNLLASIQKGVKLKKTTVTNDRSAPNLGSSSQKTNKSPAASNQEVQSNKPQGLFANGFPQLKKTPSTLNNETRPVQQPKNSFENTNSKITPISKDSPIQKSLVQPHKQEPPTNNLPPPIPKAQLTAPKVIGQFPKSQPIPIVSQKLDKLTSKWNFNSRFVPQTAPKETFGRSKRYPSGAGQGLNQYCPQPAKLDFTSLDESKELIQQTKQKLKASLRQAVDDEQFELCVEIKRFIQELDKSQEPERINQLVSDIKEQLNI